jgi:hypothetical protein
MLRSKRLAPFADGLPKKHGTFGLLRKKVRVLGCAFCFKKMVVARLRMTPSIADFVTTTVELIQLQQQMDHALLLAIHPCHVFVTFLLR